MYRRPAARSVPSPAWRSNTGSIQIYSRDAGQREAKIGFDVGQGTQDLGFRSDVDILFTCRAGRARSTLDVRDEDGDADDGLVPDSRRARAGSIRPRAAGWRPTSSSTPRSIARRARPYALPAGHVQRRVHPGAGVPDPSRRRSPCPGGAASSETFRLERWIDLAARNWFSGDHHVHAAGCAHYESPTEGVQPEDMMRHILGEDLNVGCVLSWGPCWYFQKQFFEGKTPPALDARLPDAVRRRGLRASPRRTPGTSACSG